MARKVVGVDGSVESPARSAQSADADRAVLADAFRRLDELVHGLAGRLVDYVLTGNDLEAVTALESLGRPARTALGLSAYPGGVQVTAASDRPAWWSWFVDPEGREPAVLVRLARVLAAPPPYLPGSSGAAVGFVRSAWLKPITPPDWLEPLLLEFIRSASSLHPLYSSRWMSHLSAALVGSMLAADGHPEDLLLRGAFPSEKHGGEAGVLFLVAGLAGYEEELLRHREIIDAALARTPAPKVVLVLEMFRMYDLPVAPFAESLARLAVSSARTLREPASALLKTDPVAAVGPLQARAEAGNPEERLLAVRLLGGLELPEVRTFLAGRLEAESSPKVKAGLSEILSAADATSVPEAKALLPLIEIFEGVDLGDEARGAIAALAEAANRIIGQSKRTRGHVAQGFQPITPEALDLGLSWLVMKSSWPSMPDPIWRSLRYADIKAFEALMQHPGLTPLHAVRILGLSGDLAYQMDEGHLGYFDYESPLLIHRGTHSPPMDLRVVGAALRASARDDLAIARARFSMPGFRRFDWPDDAVWPYFAEHLDWLEAAFSSGADRTWEESSYTPTQRRQEVLSILAMFPTLPARFADRVWDVALGTSKVERPIAQRCLDRLTDRDAKVLAALRSGKQAARIAAAEWAARLRIPGAAEALAEAVALERADAVRSVFLNALEQLGQRVGPGPEGGDSTAGDDRDALAAEARKGLKPGMPKGLEWFPIGELPEVRWRLDGAGVDRDSLGWLIAGAWKTRSPEPTAMLRSRAAQFHDEDAQRLGQFVLDAWLARDIRPPSEEVVTKRAEEWDQMFGHLNLPAQHPMYEQRQAFLQRPEGTALADKGLLGVVAACATPSAAVRARAYLDEHYGNRTHQCRALVEMLSWTETPEAVEVLLAVAKRFRTKSIRKEAETCAHALAGRKRMTLAELADQALPDLGLDARGRLVLDFGPRKFFARIDDLAEVVLEDEEGAKIGSLPAPRKADDASLVDRAKKDLAGFKTRVKSLRKTLTDRLHESMCIQRGWEFAAWRSTLHGHPVGGRLGRRLVWAVEGGPTFRPLEDGSLTDPDDVEVRPAPEARVRIAHALTLDESVARRWVEHLADYEVVPLFDQFPAAPYRLAPERSGDRTLTAKLHPPETLEPVVRRARGRGYDPSAFRWEDGGGNFVRHFPGAGLRSEIVAESGTTEEKVVAVTLGFAPAGESEGTFTRPRTVTLGEVPPVLLAECHADLLAIAGAGGTEASA